MVGANKDDMLKLYSYFSKRQKNITIQSTALYTKTKEYRIIKLNDNAFRVVVYGTKFSDDNSRPIDSFILTDK